MLNVLFSTTRQWNPGDEFILHGLLRLFREIRSDFNPIIFNRSPEIKHPEGREFNFQLKLSSFRVKFLRSGFYDNSFKKELYNDRFIDLIVFAGTPEWASARMKVLYEYIIKYSIPTLYLGIGVGSNDFNLKSLPEYYLQVLRQSSLITTRDTKAQALLENIGAKYLPCPAFLSAPVEMEQKRNTVKKVGLVYMVDTGVRSNTVSSSVYNFLIDFYGTLLKDYKQSFQFEFIVHYINELPQFKKDFPLETCHYSYDSREYGEIYKKFDLIVGPRVHAIALAASLGIPGINIQHDARGQTCEGFGAEILQVSSGVSSAVDVFDHKVKDGDFGALSQRILKKKNQVFHEYITLLHPIVSSLANI